MILLHKILQNTVTSKVYGSTWAPVRGGCAGEAINVAFQTNEKSTKVDIGLAHNGWVEIIYHINIYTNVKSYGSSKACGIKKRIYLVLV